MCGPGHLRIVCVLIGIAAGTALAWLLGPSAVPGNSDGACASAAALAASPWFAMTWPRTYQPGPSTPPWHCRLPWAPLPRHSRRRATSRSAEKASDAEWVRPDMRSISHGIAADGAGDSPSPASSGTLGVSSATSAIGFGERDRRDEPQDRLRHRRAADADCAASPAVSAYLLHMLPRPVLGAALMFAATFIIVNGLQVAGRAPSRRRARKTLAIGLALVASRSASKSIQECWRVLPEPARVALSSSFVLGTVIAMAPQRPVQDRAAQV